VVDTAALLALLPVPSAPAGGTGAPSVATPDQAEGGGVDLETRAADVAAATLGVVEGRARGDVRSGTTTPTSVTPIPGMDEVPATAAAEIAGGPAESSGSDPEPAADHPAAIEGAVVAPSRHQGESTAPTSNASAEAAAIPGGSSTGRDVSPSPAMVSPAEAGSGSATAAGPPDIRRFEPQARAAGTETGEPGPAVANHEAPVATDTSLDRTGPESDEPATLPSAPHRPAVEGSGGPPAGLRLDTPPHRTVEIPPSLVTRVEQAIQMIEHAPPPRRITIDADELNGMRLTVSIRPDGVAVTSPTADAATMDAIEQALRARGFDLSDSGRRRDQRHEAYERDTWRPPSGSGAVSRPRTDQGIRL
jgi:hypothetical protein